MVQRFLQLGIITVGLVKVGTAITKITSHTSPCFPWKTFSSTQLLLALQAVTEPTQQNRLISSFATLSLLTHLLSGLNSLNFPAFPFLVTFHPAAVIHFLLIWALHVLVRVCVSLKQLSPARQPDSAGNYLCIF